MENRIHNNVGDTLLDNTKHLKVQAYKRRWIILVIYMLYAAVNGFQWIEYSSITHIIKKYYNVSSMAVDWTAIIYMVTYPILVIPASYIIEKMGLRTAGLIGCIGTFFGAGVNMMATRDDLFFVVMIGQCLNGVSQLFIICLPPKMAAVWFKSNEVSTACSLGVFGTMLGNALGFIVPPMIVKNSENLDEIGNRIHVMRLVILLSMVPVTIAILLYFPKQPNLPPSVAQAKYLHSKEDFHVSIFFGSIINLFNNRALIIHMVAYGINVGVFCTLLTFLSQFVLAQFEGADELAGQLGCILILVGMGGAICLGILLDKTHKFKEITLFSSFCDFVSVVGLMFALKWQSITFCYITCISMGIFAIAYMPIGFELATELTYPSEECTTSGILMAMSQILSTLFTVSLGYMILHVGYFWSLASQAVLLLISTIITCFVPSILRRQEAYLQHRQDIGRKPSFHGSKLMFIN